MYDLEKIIIESLNRALYVHDSLGKTGEEIVQKNQFGDTALRVDVECEKAVLDFLRQEKIPIRVISEEHGTVDITENPRYLGILDGLDGSSVYKKERGMGRYGTMFGIFSNLDPLYKDYLASGIMEQSTSRLFFSLRKGGTFLMEKGKNPVQVKSSGQTELNKLTKIYINEDLAREPFNNKDLKIIRDLLDSQGFKLNQSKGSSAVDYADLAIGEKDVVLECTRKNNLEIAIAYGLTKESGGVMVDLSGEDMGNKKYNDFGQKEHIMIITASTQDLVSKIVNLMKK